MIAARQIAFGKAAGAAKPYKARLEYIEATGTQYLDTGIFYNCYTDIIDCELEVTGVVEYGYAFGANQRIDGTMYFYGLRRRGTADTWQGMGLGGTGQPLALNTRYKIRSASSDNGGGYLNDVTINATTRADFIFSDIPLYVLAVNNNIGASYMNLAKLYSWQYRRDGELIQSLIPVLDNADTPCMYDEVSGEFFYNQGEGEFIAGPVVDDVEYTAKDYVQDGLVAMWDGIENAGWETHDAAATVWKDLVGSRDLTLTSISSFENNCLVAVSPYGIAADGAELISDVGQTEMVAKTESYNKYYLHYYVYAGSYHCISRRNMFLCCALNTSVVSAYRHGLEGSASLTTKASVSVLKPTGGSGEIYKNAVNINSGVYSVAVESEAPATISVKAHGTTTRYYNIRVYNRALTAEEIAHNYNIDKQRFGL